MEIPQTNQSKYNMALATLMRLDGCIHRAFNNYRVGNISGWFFGLKELKMQIISRLNNKERVTLKDKEKVIFKLLNSSNGANDAVEEIENYNMMLQDLMAEKGLLLIDKPEETIFT